MAKGRSIDSNEDHVRIPTYDELLYIHEKVHASYEWKKKKNSSLKEKISFVEKNHRSSLIKMKDLKKALEEWKSDKIRIKIEFFVNITWSYTWKWK